MIIFVLVKRLLGNVSIWSREFRRRASNSSSAPTYVVVVVVVIVVSPEVEIVIEFFIL